MVAAPKRMKHPISAVPARRMFIRPDNMSSPMEATATTAIAVAAGPNRTACIHWVAATKTLGTSVESVKPRVIGMPAA